MGLKPQTKNLVRLQKTFDKFAEDMDDLERYARTCGRLNNRNVKPLIRRSRETINVAFDELEELDFNSGGSNDSTASHGSHGRLPVELNYAPTFPPHGGPGGIPLQTAAIPESVDSDRTHYSFASFESVGFDDHDDATSTAESVSQQQGEPHRHYITGAGGGDDDPDPEGCFAFVVGKLRAMFRRVAGFFQWLWNKIKQLCCMIRDAVCRAFNCIVDWFRNLFHRTGAHGADQEISVPISDAGFRESLLSRQGQAYARHGYHYLA